MAAIRRKTFVGPTFYLGFRSVNYYRDRLLDAAEHFINENLALEQVISICETVTGNGPYSIAIWYRTENQHTRSHSQTLSGAELREQPAGFPVIPLAGMDQS